VNIEELVTRDIERNNPGITKIEALRSLAKFSAAGSKFFRYGETVFVVYRSTESAVFFHTVNADEMKQFLRNLKEFFADLHKAGKQYAITYFSNDKLRSVYKRYGDEFVGSEDLSMGKYKGITHLKRWANGLG